MVIMLRQCCCGCTLKTGTIILGALNIVSANFPSTFLTVCRNGSSFVQEQTLKFKKLHFTRVAKVLAINIQITFEKSTSVPAHGLKVPERKHECQKKKYVKICKVLKEVISSGA
jgi:predicted metallopeptidase